MLVLKPEIACREFRVANVERRLTVQDDDDVISLGADLKVIPLIRSEPLIARRFRGPDDRDVL
jgi:hypothetical protein